MIQNHLMKIRYKNSRMKGDYEAISKFIKYEKYYYSLIFLRQPHRSEHERKKKIKKSSSCV